MLRQSVKLRTAIIVSLAYATWGHSELLAAETTIALTPANTSIAFVGSHVVPQKPDPNARKGSFAKLNGKAEMTDGKLSSLHVDIETASLTTENAKLTDHLRSPDFFNVRAYPKATFKTTSIAVQADGTHKVTGELTLLGQTQPVSFPASISTEGGLKLEASFVLDRTRFGMNYSTDKVEKTVEMSIRIK